MKRNHRAVTRSPLTDDCYIPETVVATIYKPLPQTGPLTRETTFAERATVRHARAKLRMRNRVSLSNRAMPSAFERQPNENETRVSVRLDLVDSFNTSAKSKRRVKRESPRIIGSTLLGSRRRNAYVALFPDWQSPPDSPRGPINSAPVRRRAVKLASHTERGRVANEQAAAKRARRAKEQRAKRREEWRQIKAEHFPSIIAPVRNVWQMKWRS